MFRGLRNYSYDDVYNQLKVRPVMMFNDKPVLTLQLMVYNDEEEYLAVVAHCDDLNSASWIVQEHYPIESPKSWNNISAYEAFDIFMGDYEDFADSGFNVYVEIEY